MHNGITNMNQYDIYIPSGDQTCMVMANHPFIDDFPLKKKKRHFGDLPATLPEGMFP